MAIDYILIGKRINEKRKQAGLTQEQLAEKLGVTVGYISQCERGISKINLEKLSEICDILECDLSFFVTGSTPKSTEYLYDELCEKFSNLTPFKKKQVLDIIDVISKEGK